VCVRLSAKWWFLKVMTLAAGVIDTRYVCCIGAKPLSIMTLCIMTLSIMGFNATLRIMLLHFFTVLLSAAGYIAISSVVMPCVVLLSVVVLVVMAPLCMIDPSR